MLQKPKLPNSPSFKRREGPVAVDFETYYDKECSVKHLGVVAYCHHPKFDAYLVSIFDGVERYVGNPEDFDWSTISGREWLAHNAQFDQYVFTRLKTIAKNPTVRKALGQVAPSRWIDTSGLSAYLQFGWSLKDAIQKRYGIYLTKQVRTDAEGRTWAEMVADGTAQAMLDYADDDAFWCWKLYTNCHHLWPKWEQEISEMTIEIGLRGIAVDVEGVDHDIKILERVLWEAENQIPWVKEGQKPTSPKALRAYCDKSGIPAPESMAEDSVECEAWENEYGDKYPWVGTMRQWRKCNILLKKYRRLKERTIDGIFSFSLKYCGAQHTKRFAGEAGFNMQNLHKQPFECVVDGVSYKIDLRSRFIPRKGYKMLIADFAQIEARVLAWLAGQEDVLGLVRKGISVYEAHARATMGWTGGVLKKENPELYALAKARVLGLGYGCGHIKFVDVARIMGGITISLEESKKVVYDYRSRGHQIVKLWNTLSEGVLSSIREEEKIHPEIHPEKAMKVFSCELPSGNKIHYFNLRRKKSPDKWVEEKDPVTKKIERKNLGGKIETYGEVEFGGNGRMSKKLYGGLLTENLVQGTARDILCDRLLAIRKALLRVHVLFHVHDEVIFEIPESDSEEPVLSILATSPDWAQGLPLETESEVTMGYKK